jgi:glucose/arabinose dehydrogenase
MPMLRWSPVHLVTAIVLATGLSCTETRRILVETFSGSYDTAGTLPPPPPVFDGKDAARKRISIHLTPVATGLSRPTDIQFDPSRHEVMIVLEQTGTMKWFDLKNQRTGTVKQYEVLSVSEQGLLGLTFHPSFPDTPLVYINLTVRDGDRDVSRVLELRFRPGADLRYDPVLRERVVLDVEQPYQNHNAGQLAFGPDGFLYVGWGDGGWAGDPHNHGQDASTMLGSMLRIDVAPGTGNAYTIPPDNPFVDNPVALPETWAIGLRNPWRYSFDSRGRLIVADVGQNTWEELNIVEKGRNYGWRFREGRHCYDPEVGCPEEGLVDPFYEYDHGEGQSITGGYVYGATDFPELQGLYVFGDFVSGRMWALRIPAHAGDAVEPFALGRREMLISTFGCDPRGKVYVAELGNGVIYRIDRPD